MMGRPHPTARRAAVWGNVALGLEARGLLRTHRERIEDASTTVGHTSLSRSLSTAGLLKSLSNYVGALAALSTAQDIAGLDNAAARMSTAIGELARSAGPYGAAAAPLASTKASWWLSLLGQDDLDNRRLEQLKIATEAACEPFHVLTDAVGLVLDDQRLMLLDGLSERLFLEIRKLNIAREAHAPDQAYGIAIDEAQAAADTFNAVRVANPVATAQALRDAHDALVVAVRNNDGQFAALTERLQAFAEQADALTAAIASTRKP
jgi:hypothetical protein